MLLKMKHFPTVSLFSSASSLREARLMLAGFVGKVCVCDIAWTVQCRQEDTIVGQSPGAQPQLKIKTSLRFHKSFRAKHCYCGEDWKRAF